MARDERKEGSDSAYVIGAIVFAGGAWLLWAKARPVVVMPLFAVDYVEYHILLALHCLNELGREWLSYVTDVLHHPNKSYYIKLIDIRDVENDVGYRMRYPLAALTILFVIFTAFTMKGQGFKNKFTLTGSAHETVVRLLGVEIKQRLLKKFLTADYKWAVTRFLANILLTVTGLTFIVKSRKEWVKAGTSFMHYQAQHWKVVLAGAHFDPDKKNPAELPQLSPMEWLRDNNISLAKSVLDTDAAERCFAAQLGPTWNGIEKAPYHVQAICIMAALNATLDKGVNRFRERLTEIHVLQQNTAEVETRKLMAPHMANKKLIDSINKRAGKHAYRNTAVMAIYGAGGPMREWGGGMTGVLATAMFRWLKGIDRPLWYALNNVGRRAFHIEGAGTVSHFFAERIHGQPLMEAYLDSAMDGLENYLTEQSLTDLQEFFRPPAKF